MSFEVPVQFVIQTEGDPKPGDVTLVRPRNVRLVAPDGFSRNPHGLGQVLLKQAAPGTEVLEPAPEGVPGIQEVVGVALGLGEYLAQPALERRDDSAEDPGLQDPVGVPLDAADRAVAQTGGFAEFLDREA